MINITGFIEKRGKNSNNNDDDDDENNIYIVDMNNNNHNEDNGNENRKSEDAQLPKFQMTKNGEWNMSLRNQSFHAPESFINSFKVKGIAISISQKMFNDITNSIIVAFYKKNTLVH